MTNPWLNKTIFVNGKRFRVGPASAEDRKANLKLCGISRLERIIKYPGTQKTVGVAAVRELKKRRKNADKGGG